MSCGYLDRTGRSLVEVRGDDRLSFLQGMLTNDVVRLQPGQGCRALQLTVKGKIVADVSVYVRENDVLLETDEGRAGPVREILERHIVMEDAETYDRSEELGVLAVLGEGAFEAAGVQPLRPYGHRTVGDTTVAGVAYVGQPGLHLIASRPRIAEHIATVSRAGARALSLDDVEVMRIEAGWPRWGSELTEDTIPLEAGLTEALSYDKGCYTGQEVIARVTARGQVNWQLVGLEMDGEPPVPGAVLSGDGRPQAARITSSCRSAMLGHAIALAYAFRTHGAPGTVLRLPDQRPARVVQLPFAARRSWA